jgi:hypothetical protein
MPPSGMLRLTVGAVLPDVTITFATPVLPVVSVTVSLALNCPLAA